MNRQLTVAVSHSNDHVYSSKERQTDTQTSICTNNNTASRKITEPISLH